MNVDKRPRSSTSPTSENVVIISDDDGPPRKRQKSETPALNGVARKSAKPTSSNTIRNASTPEPPERQPSTDAQGTPTAKKPSPWRNRPVWNKPASTSANPADALKISHTPVKDKPQLKQLRSPTLSKSSEWTNRDNHRLRELSLNRPIHIPANATGALARPSLKSSYLGSTRDTEQERALILDQFKFGSVTALKFNPNTDATSPKGLDNREQPAWKSHNDHPQSERRLSTSAQPRSVTSNPLPTVQVPSHKNSIVRTNAGPSSTHHQNQLFPSTTIPTTQPNPALPGPVGFSINVPLSDATKFKRERKALQERLKTDIQYAKNNSEEIEKYLGLTGFSKTFPNDLDVQRFARAAQPKKRSVNRQNISLGIPTTANTLSPHVTQEPKSISHLVHPKEQAKTILTARFSEHFEPPLTFTNDVSDRHLNGKFQFISNYILRKGVKVTGAIGQLGCTCTGFCSQSCACIRKSFKGEKNRTEKFEQVEQYEFRSDGLAVLRSDFIKRHMIYGSGDGYRVDKEQVARERVEISECNEQCPCDNSCINRVVQKGRTVPLDIFETQRCGFGVRSPVNIARGQFIELYLGEVITDHELKKREDAAEAGSTSYIYSLDWFSAQQTYHIDGENFGSAMRFVNHSCDPNTATFPVLNEKSTKQLYLVAFFAIKDIPAGTEITIDYQPHAAGTVYEGDTADEGMEQCRCGARNCRQILWLVRQERKARKKLVSKNFD